MIKKQVVGTDRTADASSVLKDIYNIVAQARSVRLESATPVGYALQLLEEEEYSS